MNTEIRDIKRKDYKKAIKFAIDGMHFKKYMESPVLLNLYGRYFWYLEINRATQIFAAYTDGKFAGVLLAEIKGEKRKHNNLFEKTYVKIWEKLQSLVSEDGAGIYEETAKEQFAHYAQSHNPDGEIIFLAADPESKIKGIGTALLNALEEKEKGKELYLYTDDACTYQFYEHRGFERTEEKEIEMKLPTGNIKLNCFIYRKRM